jgi:hypothetical protein
MFKIKPTAIESESSDRSKSTPHNNKYIDAAYDEEFMNEYFSLRK